MAPLRGNPVEKRLRNGPGGTGNSWKPIIINIGYHGGYLGSTLTSPPVVAESLVQLLRFRPGNACTPTNCPN